MEKVQTLNNGVEIPSLGFGTFQIPDGPVASDTVRNALEAGYTHLDCAAVYGNENSVGEGLRKSGVPRDGYFLASKVWNDRQTYDETLKAFQETLSRLGTDYLDLYLIHWPGVHSAECWAAMEHLYETERVRAVGVCNFTVGQIENLLETAEVVPAVNQVELHPRFPQYGLQQYCSGKGIVVESWGPLMQGKIFSVPLILELAEKHACTVSQLAVAWQLLQDNVCLTKTTRPDRMRENLLCPEIDFSPEDLRSLKTLEAERIGPDPEKFNF